MEKVFELFMADEGENHTEAWAKLLLPASPYELRDALQRARIRLDNPVYLEVRKYALEMEYLKPYVGIEGELASLYAFNALAEKLVSLNAAQRPALKQRLRAETGPLPIPRLYDLAAGEGAFRNLDLTPVEPDYTALLEVKTAHERGRVTVMLKLPATEQELEDALVKTGEEDWTKVSLRCTDCRVPILMDSLTMEGDITRINEAVRTLKAVPEEKLLKYEALLEAKGFLSLLEALCLYDTLDRYTLEMDIRCAEDAGRKELRLIISSEEVEKIIPHLNLSAYGRQTMEEYHMVLTSYGGFCRTDGGEFRKRPGSDSGGAA